jgi:hypothetical protein
MAAEFNTNIVPLLDADWREQEFEDSGALEQGIDDALGQCPAHGCRQGEGLTKPPGRTGRQFG